MSRNFKSCVKSKWVYILLFIIKSSFFSHFTHKTSCVNEEINMHGIDNRLQNSIWVWNRRPNVRRGAENTQPLDLETLLHQFQFSEQRDNYAWQ